MTVASEPLVRHFQANMTKIYSGSIPRSTIVEEYKSQVRNINSILKTKWTEWMFSGMIGKI